MKKIKGLEHLALYKERLRELELCSLEKKSSGISSTYRNTRREGAETKRATLFSVVPRDKNRDNRHKLKHRKHPVRVTEQWHKLPREVMESPTLEVFKSHLDLVLGNQLLVTLTEHRGRTR